MGLYKREGGLRLGVSSSSLELCTRDRTSIPPKEFSGSKAVGDIRGRGNSTEQWKTTQRMFEDLSEAGVVQPQRCSLFRHRGMGHPNNVGEVSGTVRYSLMALGFSRG